MDRITIRDIAAQLGVSKASVSYALNGKPGISDETRARILEHAKSLDWHPSSPARALSRSRSGTIGAVLARDPEMLSSEPFYMGFFAGIEATLVGTDHSLMIRMVPDDGDDLEVYRRWAKEGRVDGVIMTDQVRGDPRPRLVRELGLPAVMVTSCVPDPEIPSVLADEDGDAQRIVSYLHSQRHRRIAHVSGPLRFEHERVRTTAMRAAAQQVGLEVEIVEGDYTGTSGERATGELLAREHPPTAIVYSNDLMAVAGLRVALVNGLAVPRDVSVISWDDSVLCQHVHPQVTALARDRLLAGRLATLLLLRILAGGESASERLASTGLLIRASSGACGVTR